MCRGCFNQLFLRDEFHSGGIAGLFGKAAGMPTRRAFGLFGCRGLRAERRRSRSCLRGGRRRLKRSNRCHCAEGNRADVPLGEEADYSLNGRQYMPRVFRVPRISDPCFLGSPPPPVVPPKKFWGACARIL